jgi:2-phosphoglycerate kinase
VFDELKKIIAELCDVINNGVHIVPKYIKMNVNDMRDKVFG